jgi:hypothetical protein
MKYLLLLAVLVLPACSAATRAPSSSDKAAFEVTFMKRYLAKNASSGVLADAEFRPARCDDEDHDGPGGKSCVQTVCGMGPLKCERYESDLQKAMSLCKETSGACLSEMCAMGPYKCDRYQSDLEKVVGLCKDVRPGCAKLVCGYGPLQCERYESDLTKAIQLCRSRARTSCIKDTCAMGPYKCDRYQSDLEKVIALCGAQ